MFVDIFKCTLALEYIRSTWPKDKIKKHVITLKLPLKVTVHGSLKKTGSSAQSCSPLREPTLLWIIKTRAVEKLLQLFPLQKENQIFFPKTYKHSQIRSRWSCSFNEGGAKCVVNMIWKCVIFGGVRTEVNSLNQSLIFLFRLTSVWSWEITSALYIQPLQQILSNLKFMSRRKNKDREDWGCMNSLALSVSDFRLTRSQWCGETRS